LPPSPSKHESARSGAPGASSSDSPLPPSSVSLSSSLAVSPNGWAGRAPRAPVGTRPGVHGAPGSQYYLQAGSRVGIAFNAGIVDILVQAPTIAWSSQPFAAKEILSVALSIRLN